MSNDNNRQAKGVYGANKPKDSIIDKIEIQSKTLHNIEDRLSNLERTLLTLMRLLEEASSE